MSEPLHPEPYLAAAVQMTSTADVAANLAQASELVRRAASYGARFVATPENTNFLGQHTEKTRRAEALAGLTVAHFAALAQELEIHLLLGSFNEVGKTPERCYNTSVLFGPDGTRHGLYRKIHLFDVDLSDAVRFQESATVQPGTEPVVLNTALGKLGLSICYDLRFPELYRCLAEGGAEILAVPAAFTRPTGQDHWLALLRARAIETQSWVIAPAQHGLHDDRGLRETYGRSAIIDPWGTVVATAPDGPGLALAEIDIARAHQVRRAMPVAQHHRL